METGNIAMIRKARPYPSAKAVVPAVRNGTHRYADTLVAMKDGRVMARGPYTELLTEEPVRGIRAGRHDRWRDPARGADQRLPAVTGR